MKKNLMLTNMKRLVMAVMLCAFALGGKAQTAVTINPSSRLQTVEGWGVSLCWWAAQAGQWDDAKINEIADWLVSPDGLNYNVFRYNIPGGDAPGHDHMSVDKGGKGLRTRMAGFAETEADFTNKTYKWENDEAQIKMMRAIIARAEYYGKKNQIMIEAFANTPPYWMTTSGCASGASSGANTNLKSAYYDKFAEYLVDVCQHFKEVEGIEFYTLEPFNEPNSDYWKQNGDQEGCGFKPADQVKFVRDNLYPRLSVSGLNTVISVSDETNLSKGISTWGTYSGDANVMGRFAQWNVHTYSGTDAQRETMRNSAKGAGKRLWMSETGPDNGSGITSNLGLAKKLFSDMRILQPVVWCDWQAMETNTEWCLFTCSGDNDKYVQPVYRNKNYFVRSQITSNIKVGYTIIETGNSNVLAAVNPDKDEMVVCLLNTGTSSTSYNLNVPSQSGVVVKKSTITDASRDCVSYSVGNVSNVSVPKESIVTIVLNGDFSLSMTDSDGRDLVFGGKYMISTTKQERVVFTTRYPDFYFYASDDNSAVSSKKDFPSVESTGFYAPQYIWEPALVGKDKITLQNMKHGKYLAGNTPDLSATDAEDAMTFLPSGPFTKHNNTPNFWVLEGETGSEYKYLNWSGATEGNGFCYWTAGESDNGSNFRFHKIEYVHINAYAEKNGEKEPVSFKLNNNASLVYTGSAELYHLSISGKVTAFALNQTVEDVMETKYILNGEKQASSFDVKNLKNGDVLDVVYVCKSVIPVAITTAQYATLYYSDKALKVPADVEAYIYTYDDVNNNVESTAYKAGEVIPAGEAVLLHSVNKLTATKEFLFDVVDSNVAPNSENLLKGTDVNQDIQDSNHNCYVLKNNNGHLAFYYATPDGNGKFTNGAHKAYLQLPSTALAMPAMIELDGETSGIMIVNDNDDDNDDFLFNVAGQRVGDNYKGIVIKNGKKFVNK